MSDYKLIFRQHAVERMFARNITFDNVYKAIEAGEVIKEYLDDTPYPSRLILGWVGKRPLHIVAADNHNDGETIIITVYEPDIQLWKDDFRRKRL